MAANEGSQGALTYKSLLALVPVVMDFLDLGSEDVIASGILEDTHLDDSVIAMILSKGNATSTATDTFQHYQTKSESTTFDFSGLSVTPVRREEMDNFRRRFRMTPSIFDKLLKDLCDRTSFCTKPALGEANISQREMLQQVLRFLGSQDLVETLAKNAGMQQSSYTNLLYEMFDVLFELLPCYVYWPQSKSSSAEVKEGFTKTYGLHGVAGTLKTLHVKIEMPEEHAQLSQAYVNASGETTVILQSVCDHQLCFLHCSTGWPGSINDSRVLKNSDLYKDITSHKIEHLSESHHLIGDECHESSEWLCTPSSSRVMPTQPDFPAACRNALKDHAWAYTLLLRRFPRLEKLKASVRHVGVCVSVCCGLHNFCLRQGDLVFFEDNAAGV
jgi:hypothetical protein